MTRVNAMRTAKPTLAQGGVMASLFSGRSVEVLRGYDPDPSKARGFRRLFRGERSFRPGAYSPRVDRVPVNLYAPASVGTTMVLGGLDAMKERNERFGVAGSRAPYARHAPKRAGLSGPRLPMTATPAYQILETAFARTGVPVLYSRFAAPAGMTPAGLRGDPIPARAHVNVGGLVVGPSPVGCLPGTPGCYASPSGAVPTGVRKPWWLTQNEGQASMPIFSRFDSPLPTQGLPMGSPLGIPSESTEITLPISAPGTIHSLDAAGGSSYLPEAGYPNYTSPWGYSGAERVGAQPPLPSGQDMPFVAFSANAAFGRRVLGTAAAVGAIAYLVLKRKRR